MSDTRPRVKLNGKTINLGQLDAELGNVGLSASDDEVVVVDEGSATQEQLQAAVDAHVADDDFGKEPDELTLEDYKAKAEAGTLTSSDIAPALALILKLRA